MKKYLKYYFLEDYLFKTVNKNFHENKYLTSEEFLAIIIWKRNASKTKVVEGVNTSDKSIRVITSKIYESPSREMKLEILLGIKNIGIAIASAILTVLYDQEFTVFDARARNSLQAIGVQIKGSPDNKPEDYFSYVDLCKKQAEKYKLSLRDFDRCLWAMNFYIGEGGLKEIAETLK